jgi:mRNA interferase MazF
MKSRFADLQQTIENMGLKRGQKFIEWMKTQNQYLQWENGFEPSKLRKYNRGDIIYVNFGFNPGSEIGGLHYAVVMDDNEKSNPVVNVVPLGSLESGQTRDVLHKHEIYIGTVDGMNQKEAFAIPNQFQPVSKLRIYRPRKGTDIVVKLPGQFMDMIDEKILRLFTRRYSAAIAQLETAQKSVASGRENDMPSSE